MARHFNKHKKINKHKRRLKNKVAMQLFKHKFKIAQAKKHVINLSQRQLSDNEYLLLSRGLKFIPTPFVKGAKAEVLRDFDELARKMRCRYLYHDNVNEIHPFKSKSGYTPPPTCGVLENYIYKTRHDLSSLQVQKFRDNLNPMERASISSLKKDKDIIIKKSDKGSNIVILDKHNYLSEAYRQLNSQHYIKLDTFDFKDLRYGLNTYLRGMFSRGVLDEITFDYLMKGNQNKYGPGYMHILPKIHRLNQSDILKIEDNGFNIDKIIPPGRPIISQIGTVTECIGRYVDYFLVPIVQNQHTYIKDTADFIHKIENIKPPADCWLCSFDISQMFTNCPINEILSAVKIAYNDFDKAHFKIKCPPTDDLIYLLKSILENNVFEFNGELFQQIIGAAIGAIPSPEVCDILMYQIMKEILSNFKGRKNIFFYGRYRDDGFMIFNGNVNDINEFFNLANNHHRFLKFTHEISQTAITFLDVNIYKGKRFFNDSILDMKTYFKPTNSFLYLHRNSCHNRHVFSALIKNEVVRYIKTTSDQDVLQHMLTQFKLNLIKRGYKEIEIMRCINEALIKNRSDLINKNNTKLNKEIPLVLSSRYNPCIGKLKQCIIKHWHLLNQDEVCKEIFTEQPIIAYKRHRNLADLLTSTKLKH